MEFEYQLKEAEEYGIRKGRKEGFAKCQNHYVSSMITKGYSDEEILSIADDLTADDLRAMRERA